MLFYPHVKLEQGVGIEPTLGPHLGHTGYKSVGASNYTNLALNLIGSYNIFYYCTRSFFIELKLIFIIWRFRVRKYRMAPVEMFDQLVVYLFGKKSFANTGWLPG